MIGWTTTSNKKSATDLAKVLIDKRLAACAQISGPITSIYRWDSKIQEEQEYRLTLKFPEEKAEALALELKHLHPYDIPQWVTVEAESVSVKYQEWVDSVTED